MRLHSETASAMFYKGLRLRREKRYKKRFHFSQSIFFSAIEN